MRLSHLCGLFAITLTLTACFESEADRRARFASDARVKADVIQHLQDTYGLRLPPEALEVRLGCTVMNSSCALAVSADANAAGINRRFALWPHYQSQGTEFTLTGIDDNLRPQIIEAPIQAYVESLLETPDAPLVTIRVQEYNGFVGIEPQLPTDLVALSQLSGPELLQQYGQGIGLNLFVYVLASPSEFEPRVRVSLERLLADPVLTQLGHGLDVKWFFRKERLPGPKGERDADALIVDGDGRSRPDAGPDNTQAKWRLQIGGREYGNDFDEPIATLWARLDREEPMLTQ